MKQIAPPLDEGLDKLERQGFCTSINHSRWKSTQGNEIRSKACFDMQPTNPHVGITPTGHYEVWIRTVDFVRLIDDIAQNRSPMINATRHKVSLPKLYEARAACIYKPDGKCIGMMTPERFHLLRERFHEAQKNGLHRDMSSPVQCLASEIAGLLQDHQARLKTPKASKLTLESYSRILPQHISAALQQCAMVSKERMASALKFDPGNSSYWSERHRDIVLVPITMHWPPSLQVSQSATQCMMTQKCSSACDTPYDLRCVASYQPPPSYFYPTGKTRASMPTEHWCEITQNTAPRLASSPRQNSHMQCQPRGRVYNVISPTTPGAWILLLSGTKKQNSV
jgi:hypothetical protein